MQCRFFTIAEYTSQVVNGILSFSNLPIYEGTYVTNRYTVDTKNVDQKFYINDANGDTTTLIVDVFDNASATSSTTFTQALDNTQVKSNSDVYYLQESVDGKFEIYCNKQEIFLRHKEGKFIEIKEIKKRIRDFIDPERLLGHIDRKTK